MVWSQEPERDEERSTNNLGFVPNLSLVASKNGGGCASEQHPCPHRRFVSLSLPSGFPPGGDAGR